jgi:hypothetical protein
MPKGIYKRNKRNKPIWNKGKVYTEEEKKLRKWNNKPNKGSFSKGHIPWSAGTKGVRIAWNKGKKRWWSAPGSFKKGENCGDKNHNWKGGISFEPYSVDWTQTLKRSIRERDKYTCQICKCQPEVLFIHHIDYNKQNCNSNNLISLCNSCHSKTNYNREYWINYLTNII